MYSYLILLLFIVSCVRLQVLPSNVATDEVPPGVEPSALEKWKFFDALLADITDLTEETIARRQRIFAFDKTDLVSLCSEHERNECRRLAARLAVRAEGRFPAVSFAGIGEVTGRVNTTISRLNVSIARLACLDNRLYDLCKNKEDEDDNRIPVCYDEGEDGNIISVCSDEEYEDDNRIPVCSDEDKEKELKTYDELRADYKKLNKEMCISYKYFSGLLIDAATTGILPLLFTKVFELKSGSLYLPPQEPSWYASLLKKYHNFRPHTRHLLNELSLLSVSDAITEVNKSLLDSWLQLQKLSWRGLPSDQDIYEWIAAHDFVASNIVLKNPAYENTRAYFIEKFTTKSKSPFLSLIDNISIATSLVLAGVMLSPQGQSIVRAATIASAAINYLDSGIGLGAQIIVNSELLRREHALIIGSSKKIDAYLDRSRTYDKLSDNVKLSLTAGMILTALSIRHIVKFRNEPVIRDFLAGLLSIVMVDDALKPDEDPGPGWLGRTVVWFLQMFH